MNAKDEAIIDELFDKYKEAKYIRETYWDDLVEPLEDLQQSVEYLSGDAVIDPICKKNWALEKYKLSDVATLIEKATTAARERLQELNNLIDDYHSDICGRINDGTVLTIEDEDFIGYRGRGLCGMDDYY